ncbi:MAG: MATE family efflux transporter [Hymenobacter sp.]
MLLVLGLGMSMGAVPLRGGGQRARRPPGAGPPAGRHGVAQYPGGRGCWPALSQLLPLVLPYLGQAPEVVALAAPWVRVVGLSLLPLMVFQGFREWAEGLGLTRQAMRLSIAANVLNALLCYALIFGHFGAPQDGADGLGLGHAASRALAWPC